MSKYLTPLVRGISFTYLLKQLLPDYRFENKLHFVKIYFGTSTFDRITKVEYSLTVLYIGRSDGTSAASEVISEVSAASEHSAAVTIRRSGTVAESGCICRIGEVLCLFDNLRMMDSAQIRV